jgi:hypothetical protein
VEDHRDASAKPEEEQTRIGPRPRENIFHNQATFYKQPARPARPFSLQIPPIPAAARRNVDPTAPIGTVGENFHSFRNFQKISMLAIDFS